MADNLPFEFSQRKVELYKSLVPNPTEDQIQAIHALEESDRELEDFLATLGTGDGTTNSWIENYGLGTIVLAPSELTDTSISNTNGVPFDAPLADGPLARDQVFHTVMMTVKPENEIVPKNIAMRILEPGMSPMISSPWNGFRVREQEDYDTFGQAGEPYTWTFTVLRSRKNFWRIQFENFGDEEIELKWTVSILANRRHVYGGSF